MPAERDHIRRRADLLTTVALTIISLCALVVTVWQTQVMQAQQQVMQEQAKLSAWPFLEINMQTQTTSGNRIDTVSLHVVNKGIGPAIVEKAQVYLDGQPLGSLEHLIEKLDTLAGATGEPYLFSRSLVDRRALLPSEQQALFQLYDSARIARFRQYAGQMKLQICFRSAFNDYWLITRDGLAGGEPLITEECPQCPDSLQRLQTKW